MWGTAFETCVAGALFFTLTLPPGLLILRLLRLDVPSLARLAMAIGMGLCLVLSALVVMVEGLFVALDHHAKVNGMERFNKLSKLGLIRKTGSGLGKAVFFSKLIIISALLPIFSFQKVEGKMFSPLAYTLGFALLGALIFTLTLVPVLVSILLIHFFH